MMDLSENELAKTHGRSLIGGRAPTDLTTEEKGFKDLHLKLRKKTFKL